MPSATGADNADRHFFVGLARAFGGAIFFSIPLLLTLEMSLLGFYMDRFRLALFMTVMIPMLVILNHYSGFVETSTWLEDILDAFIGYGIGILSAASALLLLNVITLTQPLSETIGQVCLQAIPAALGAVLAASQLGRSSRELQDETSRADEAGYVAQLFFMVVGAVFLSFSIAPTRDVMMISESITPWHGIGLILAALLMMHGFVYASEFRGTPDRPEGVSGWSIFLRYTVVGYVLAVLVSAYVLWTFGRLDSLAFPVALLQTVLLALPASLGAAAARLIL